MFHLWTNYTYSITMPKGGKKDIHHLIACLAVRCQFVRKIKKRMKLINVIHFSNPKPRED